MHGIATSVSSDNTQNRQHIINLAQLAVQHLSSATVLANTSVVTFQTN